MTPKEILTRRELFAGMALQGLLANPALQSALVDRINMAVSLANNLIDALKREEECDKLMEKLENEYINPEPPSQTEKE